MTIKHISIDLGRTGRAGKKGISIIIGSTRDKRKISSLEKTINREIINKDPERERHM